CMRLRRHAISAASESTQRVDSARPSGLTPKGFRGQSGGFGPPGRFFMKNPGYLATGFFGQPGGIRACLPEAGTQNGIRFLQIQIKGRKREAPAVEGVVGLPTRASNRFR